MPRYRSVGGKWYPVKEQYIDSNAEDTTKAVYIGPDRAASEVLKEQGAEFLGNDCRLEETTSIKARNVGCKDADEYLQRFKGVSIDEMEKKQKELLDKEVHNANKNELTIAKPINPPSGGQDTSGQGKSRKGGFGTPDDVDIGSKRT